VAVFLVRCDGYFRLFARHKNVISDGQLHYGRHTNSNRKLSPLMYYFGTENGGGTVAPGRLRHTVKNTCPEKMLYITAQNPVKHTVNISILCNINSREGLKLI